jgi:hypothetical protein
VDLLERTQTVTVKDLLEEKTAEMPDSSRTTFMTAVPLEKCIRTKTPR